MKTYSVTFGHIHTNQNNQFCHKGKAQIIRAKNAKNAAAAALNTRAKLAGASEHDIENVWAEDRLFEKNRSIIFGAQVEEI
jgi:hypothetical protein